MNTITKLVAAVLLCAFSVATGIAQQTQPAFDAVAVEAKASNGDVPSMVQLGKAYWYGRGVSKDVDKGRVWFDRASAKGSLEAQLLLGAAYFSGTDLPKNRQAAAKYLLQVAQGQNTDPGFQSSQAFAQLLVALMFKQGNGAEQSDEKGLEFLKLAAENGNYTAQYELASLYNNGTGGVTMDKVHACDLFENAADQGHVMAMHNVGYCYQIGVRGKADNNKAIAYYTKAAEAGSTRSQENLGLLFGRAGNAEKAYFWLRVAESRGETELRSILDQIGPALPPKQVDALEKEVTAWLNAHPAKEPGTQPLWK